MSYYHSLSLSPLFHYALRVESPVDDRCYNREIHRPNDDLISRYQFQVNENRLSRGYMVIV